MVYSNDSEFLFFSPTPEIEWVRINGDLVTSRMIQYHQELLIRGIEFSDAGMYECRGKNAISAVQSHRFKLEVECKFNMFYGVKSMPHAFNPWSDTKK